MSDEVRAPWLIDPGATGWAEEPKITRAEESLYGDLAGVVRLLGTASTAASDAYSLTCKRGVEDRELAFTDDAQREVEEVFRPLVQATWDAYRKVQAVQHEVAQAALSAHAEAVRRHGEIIEVGDEASDEKIRAATP